MPLQDFSARLATGEDRSLADWAGKVVLAVNVASRCGLTPQYQGLQQLQERFGARGFTLAPLLAEHVAAIAMDAPSPLPGPLADIVDPARFRAREARRRS